MDKKVKDAQQEMAFQMLDDMPLEKKLVLKKACDRNNHFTSTFGLEHGTLYHTQHGFYLKLDGCQCSFSVYMNNDMEYTRKPSKEVLGREFWIHMDRYDYDKLRKL